MFERYTERARRVIFFARYEASQLGSSAIETEHLLLGLIREGKGLTSRLFSKSHLSMDQIRKEIEGRSPYREKVSTSVEIPLSVESKRVLGHAAEEAERMLHNYIGTEHILLGLMREERSVAAAILAEKGMRLASVREDILALLNEKASGGQVEGDAAALRVLARPDRGRGAQRPRPAGRPRRGARARRPGAVPPHPQQPGADRRAGRRARRRSSRASRTRSSRATCRSTSPTSASSPSTSR